jgi:hypothetical protein
MRVRALARVTDPDIPITLFHLDQPLVRPRYVDKSQAMQETLPGYALRYGYLGGRYKPNRFAYNRRNEQAKTARRNGSGGRP